MKIIMRKYFLGLLLISITIKAYTQDYGAISLRSGISYFEKKTYIGPGASFQFELFKNVSVGLNSDFQFGSNNSFLFKIEPRIDYYLKNGFNGLHVGVNTSVYWSNSNILNPPDSFYFAGYNFPTSKDKKSDIAAGIGANIGYTKPISKRYFIDFTTSVEYFKVFNITNSNVIIKPVLSFGMKFL